MTDRIKLSNQYAFKFSRVVMRKLQNLSDPPTAKLGSNEICVCKWHNQLPNKIRGLDTAAKSFRLSCLAQLLDYFVPDPLIQVSKMFPWWSLWELLCDQTLDLRFFSNRLSLSRWQFIHKWFAFLGDEKLFIHISIDAREYETKRRQKESWKISHNFLFEMHFLRPI